MGRLIQKHQRQLACCDNAPPMTGPVVPAITQTSAVELIYSDRCRMLKRSEMIILTKDIIPPPARPCTPLPEISMGMFTAAAAIVLPMKKTTIAPNTAYLRPQMSLTRTHMGLAAHMASK